MKKLVLCVFPAIMAVYLGGLTCFAASEPQPRGAWCSFCNGMGLHTTLTTQEIPQGARPCPICYNYYTSYAIQKVYHYKCYDCYREWDNIVTQSMAAYCPSHGSF